MKKKLSLLMIVFMAVAAFAIQVGKRASATTWTVAGNSTELFGSAWDPAATANDMTLDGDVYKWTKTDVALPAFTEVQFKVCGDHAWTVAFPAENYGFTIPENGKYTVVITFNAATEEITATATKTGDATFPDAEITKVQICGAKDASWTNRIDFGLTKGEGNVYTGVLDASDYEDDVEFKLVVNGDTWIGFDQLTMNAPDGWVEKPEFNDNFLLKNSSTRYKSYNITATWVSNALANKGWTVKIEGKEPRTKDVEISPASGDISEAINAELGSNYFAKNVTVNLAADATYTVTAPIVAGGSVIISGPAELAEGAKAPVIDASGNTTGAFILMSKTPAVAANSSGAYIVENVAIKNAAIENLKGSLFYDNKIKYGIADFTIDNAVIKLAESAVNYESIIAFEGGGTKTFTIKNSTVYGTGTNVSKYFFRYGGQGRLDRLGYNTSEDLQSWTYTNNTFYNLLKSDGQWGNGQNGQSYMAYYVDKNIWYNCGASNQSIIQRLGFGRIATEHTSFTLNTFFNGSVDNSVKETSYETDFLITNPGFDAEKVAAGDFTISAGTAQAKFKTGDPRWLVDFVAPEGTGIVKPIEISPESGADITAVLATEKNKIINELNEVGNITINLAADGSYKATSSIEAPASVIISGPAELAEGAKAPVIDASGNTTGAFILMSKTPAVAANSSGAYIVENVAIKNAAIENLKGSLFYDNKIKYGIADFTIDNAVIKLAESAVNYESIIAFEGGGTKTFTIKNSTVYGTGTNVSKYFFRYGGQGRLDRLGYNTSEDLQSWTYTNNTFYNLLKSDGQWGNGQNGQSYMAYYVDKNIWYNCGASNQSIIQRLGFGRIATEHKSFVKNTFFNGDKDNSAKETLETDALTTAPYFKDAANGDFAIASHSAQAKAEGGQTGDARWGTWDAGYAVTVGECTGGTVTADKPYAAEGEKVYPILTPAEGYAVEKLPTIKNEAGDDVTSSITFGEDETGKYFVMPAFNITVDYEFSKLYTITLPTETTNGTVTIVKPAEGNQSVAGKEIKLKVTGLADGYKVVVKNGDTDITLNEGDHTNYDYYFTMPEGDVTISIVDGTGINGITVDGVSGDIFSDGKPVYNLSGQRVFKGYKGVVIKNGRKVVIK